MAARARHNATQVRPDGVVWRQINETQWETFTHPSALPEYTAFQMPPQYHTTRIEEDSVTFADRSIRNPFLRKVYAILTCHSLFMTGIIALFLFISSMESWAVATCQLTSTFNTATVLVLLLIITIIPLAFENSVRRKFAVNVIYLVLMTLAESSLLGFVSVCTNTLAIFMMMGLLSALYLTLTVFAGDALCFMLSSLIGVPLMSYGIYWFLLLHQNQKQIPALVGASIFACLFASIFAINIYEMIHKNKYSVLPHEYVFAVLNIYLYIYYIFFGIRLTVGGTLEMF